MSSAGMEEMPMPPASFGFQVFQLNLGC